MIDVAGRSVIQFFIYFQTSAQDWAFLAKLPWLKCVNFRYICKVVSQLWLMPPLSYSFYLFILLCQGGDH